MPETDIDKIEPVDFDLEQSPLFSTPAPAVNSNKPSTRTWVILASLVIVALLVIFVLPTVVTEYELPLERRVAATEPSLPVQGAAANAISPFEEAQRALQRKEAQDVLAELLAKQGELDLLAVSQWGQLDYESALEQASIGDEYYRTQEFGLARDSYSAGRDGLIDLYESIPSVLAQTLITADLAFEQGDAATALEAYALALILDPENAAASRGLARAETLEEVSQLIADAAAALKDEELERAKQIYQQVLSLDNLHDHASNQIAVVDDLLIQSEFSSIMSEGYSLLEQDDPEQAIAFFQQASLLGVNQEQALAAITQTENEVANFTINQIREVITLAEAEEQWQLAVDEYDKVLAIDGNLLFATNGRDYADKRARLNELLVQALDNPERFAEDAVFEQTRDVYFTGRAIDPPGEVLQRQLDSLQPLLESSQVPIDVQLRSDNFTEVSLLRIADLGTFEQTSLSLKPGNYVAVGRRSGYREVREEFTVGFGLTPGSVVVRCEERIATNVRR